MENTLEQLTTFLIAYGLKVLGAILILVAGRIAAGFARRLIARALNRCNADPTIVGFTSRLGFILVIVVAVLASLAKFGIETTSFVAVLGAAGFAIGFALQGTLSHFAAGIMIILFRPYKVGDFIDAAGVMGNVKEIRLFTTVMATPDNVTMIVPNGKIFGDIIKNFSVNETRRVDVTVGIGYGESIDRAIEVLLDVMKADERIIPEPEPQIVVSELADSSVNLLIRCWTRRTDFWAVKCDLTKNIKDNFDIQSIEIPYPQRVVHNVTASRD
jgi:small conductance mechanosensitive channel